MLLITKIASKQKILDTSIRKKFSLKELATFQKRVLALVVEIAELANETKCFKYWSKKKPSPKLVILEEYVDGMHFLTSIGLSLNYNYQKNGLVFPSQVSNSSLSKLFLDLFNCVTTITIKTTHQEFENIYQKYLVLGVKLGFNSQDIMLSYDKKNNQNHQRQKENY